MASILNDRDLYLQIRLDTTSTATDIFSISSATFEEETDLDESSDWSTGGRGRLPEGKGNFRLTEVILGVV